MSAADPPVVAGAPMQRRRGALGRLFGAEIALVFARRRNQVLLALLVAVPVLVGAAVRIDGPPADGQGPQFLNQVTGNGLFLVFTSLVVTLPLLLPLVIGIVAGDQIAGEAGAGTLRYLLTVPWGLGRLLVAKLVGTLAFTTAGVLALGAVGLATGAVLFPVGRVTLLSGDTIPFSHGLVRGLLISGYVIVSLTGLVVVGLLLSTLTEVPVAAMAGTIVLAVVSEVIDALPQLHVLHPFLLTHHWLDFGELLRPGPRVGLLLRGVAVQAGYVAVAGSVAWSRFSGADVTA